MQRLWALSHALEVRSKGMARTLGVTGPQRLVIRIIGQLPRASARDISSTLGMHPSTLTGILARLQAHALILRKTDDEDRRVSRFRLTGAGERIDHERKGTVEAAIRRALGRADRGMIEGTMIMLELLAAELERE
ncbi:MAG: MarR family transcriptional regulator [Deltaproteobacteria bacterium]|nr:MarR family transcriptional regulator [Deltaproteobacteria bacterium]